MAGGGRCGRVSAKRAIGGWDAGVIGLMRPVRRSELRVSTLVFNHGLGIARIQDRRDFAVGSYERGLRWFADPGPPRFPFPLQIPRCARSASSGLGGIVGGLVVLAVCR